MEESCERLSQWVASLDDKISSLQRMSRDGEITSRLSEQMTELNVEVGTIRTLCGEVHVEGQLTVYALRRDVDKLQEDSAEAHHRLDVLQAQTDALQSQVEREAWNLSILATKERQDMQEDLNKTCDVLRLERSDRPVSDLLGNSLQQRQGEVEETCIKLLQKDAEETCKLTTSEEPPTTEPSCSSSMAPPQQAITLPMNNTQFADTLAMQLASFRGATARTLMGEHADPAKAALAKAETEDESAAEAPSLSAQPRPEKVETAGAERPATMARPSSMLFSLPDRKGATPQVRQSLRSSGLASASESPAPRSAPAPAMPVLLGAEGAPKQPPVVDPRKKKALTRAVEHFSKASRRPLVPQAAPAVASEGAPVRIVARPLLRPISALTTSMDPMRTPSARASALSAPHSRSALSGVVAGRFLLLEQRMP